MTATSDYLVQDLPQHWQTLATKRAFSIRLGKMLQREPGSGMDEQVPYLKANHVQWSGVSTADLPLMWASHREILEFGVTKGDLLVCEGGEAGRAATLSEEPAHNCIIQNALHRVRGTRGGEIRFLRYVLEMVARAEWFTVLCNRATIAHLTGDKLAALRIPLPPINEQRMIADFLDRETTKVDDLVDCKTTLLRQLEDRERSLITRTVCKGLNGSVQARATGIPWIGDVPEHWELLHLRRVVRKFVDYRGRTPEKVPDGVPLVTAVNVKNGRIDLSLGQEFMPEADYDEWMVRGLPERGDLLVTTEAPLGEVAQIEDTRVALAQRIILLKVKKKKISNEYLKYFFRSAAGQGELWTRASGSTALGIKASRFKGIAVVVPPLSEQCAIVEYLDRETSRLSQLKAAVEASLPRLAEYRSALISAAVTGQIDIRNYRPQEAAALCQ